MTKNELMAIVTRVYASWNQVVPASNAKEVYEAWWRVLKDLTVADVDHAIDTLVIRDSFMPRPGAVRRLVKTSTIKDLPPAPLEAWQILRDMAAEAHNGSYSPVTAHECVMTAIGRLGGVAAFSLHTNGDREAFVEVYRQVATAWEDKLFAIESD